MNKTLLLIAVLAMSGCAAVPTTSTEPDSLATLGATTVRYTTLAQANTECERRMNNGKQHWGCATYNATTRSCDIVVGDVDRSAVLGKELNNCVRMSQGLPK